jgi:hypothetical protein
MTDKQFINIQKIQNNIITAHMSITVCTKDEQTRLLKPQMASELSNTDYRLNYYTYEYF